MELKPGLSALVTGAAAGIGKAICMALAERGIFVTVVDFSENGEEVADLVKKGNAKFFPKLKFPSSMFIRCDVTNSRELSSAFQKHLKTYGALDICINSAGIANFLSLDGDKSDGSATWRHTLNVNLIAVIDCTRLAIEAMQATQRQGVIINMGSAAGLYPLYQDPIYSASKGGVVLFTRSLLPYKHQGIRVNVLCPEFVKTDLLAKVDHNYINSRGGFLPVDIVVKGVFQLIQDETKAGSCLWITNRRGLEYWPTPMEEAKYQLPSSKLRRKPTFTAPVSIQIPQSFEKIVVSSLSHNFRSATGILRVPLRLPIKSNHVLVKIIYAGVNASDVNFSSGHYFGGKDEDLRARLPFDAGFEAVGIIAAVDDSVHDLQVGIPVAVMTFGSFAEFMMVPSKYILPVAGAHPEVVAMLTSGLTASIALDKVGQMDSGKVVLITAAAGGTGQFAVQLAKLAGNKVVATCGGKGKAELLKYLGVDRVIDYKEEDVETVLKNEFSDGVDIIYESVGGQMFDICLNALAIYGRLIVIGMMSQYQGNHGWKPLNYPGLCEKLLARSQTLVRTTNLGGTSQGSGIVEIECPDLMLLFDCHAAFSGFFLIQYRHLWRQHLNKLFHLFSLGHLKVTLDPRSFVGLRSVADAVEYLHSGRSIGKVVVCIDPTFRPREAKL